MFLPSDTLNLDDVCEDAPEELFRSQDCLPSTLLRARCDVSAVSEFPSELQAALDKPGSTRTSVAKGPASDSTPASDLFSSLARGELSGHLDLKPLNTPLSGMVVQSREASSGGEDGAPTSKSHILTLSSSDTNRYLSSKDMSSRDDFSSRDFCSTPQRYHPVKEHAIKGHSNKERSPSTGYTNAVVSPAPASPMPEPS